MSAEEIQQIKSTIAVLEAQRAVLGDATVDTALAPLREKLAALTRAAPPADERKRVTVLFSDLAGFTARSEVMDPEDVHAIMDTYFERMSAAITQYEGTVEKYIGDAVMALYGAPKALENHEEMAVRAALAMHEALEDLNDEIERGYGFRLAMRIGVNTGLVLFGSMGGRVDEDFAAVGTTINLASRLESACPVGGVMVSAETAERLQAIFDFEPPQQISVKGKTEPMTVYVVIGEKAHRGRVRGVRGLSAPMLGRDEELARLQTLFVRALNDRCWRVAAAIGEAGVGKSRLRREFVAWATQAYGETRLLLGRCYAHTQNTPYHLVGALLRELFNIGQDADADVALERLTGALRALGSDLSESEFRYQLGSLAGVLGFSILNDPLQSLAPERRRDRTFLSLERLLLSVSAATPLLVVLEDLHWADALSLLFIERLIQRAGETQTGGQGAFFLVVTRPAEDAESDLGYILERMTRPPHCTLALHSLDIEESGCLVSRLLEGSGLPHDVLSLVLERAQGNPFFLEEILRSFIDDGTLKRASDTGEWTLTRTVAEMDVPRAVHGVMAARLDRLPPEDKHITHRAAIIGRTFWQRLLAHVASADGTAEMPDVEGPLSHLEARQLVLRIGESQVLEDWEWAFRYVLAQEVAYESVTKGVRRRVHGRVARFLEANAVGHTESSIPLIAYHYAKADVQDKAVTYLRQAGAQAAAHFANEDAVDHYSQALELLDRVDQEPAWIREQRYAALLGREAVYALLGRRQEQAADLDALSLLVEEMGDDGARAEVALRQAAYHEATSAFKLAHTAARKAAAWAEAASEPQQRVKALIAEARALWRQGQLEEAGQQLKQGMALARRHGDRAGEATTLHHMGTVSYFLGDHRAARDHLERALTIRRELGDRPGSAISLSNLVGVYYGLGDLTGAKASSEQALAVHRTIGDRRGEAHALTNLASIELNLGNLKAARSGSEEARALYRAIGDRGGEALSASNLGLILHAMGQGEAARRCCEEALAIRREVGDRRGEGYTLTYLGMALEGLGEPEEAAAAYERALRLRREMGQEGPAIDDVAGLARAALNTGDLPKALAYVEEALEWIEAHDAESVEYPLRVFLTAADVLVKAGQRERAEAVLQTAHALLQRRAARIGDEATRRDFLENVPPHREVLLRVSATE
jgi:predicted ATPase/class 3 adenylate cyclase